MGDIPSKKFRFESNTNIPVVQKYVYLILLAFKDECAINVAVYNVAHRHCNIARHLTAFISKNWTQCEGPSIAFIPTLNNFLHLKVNNFSD
jgi:hypothetical protein